mmetsp:Transcript_7348/g.12684  ORF Transcript_7348/g.12684 Transcript_7348/m.12684 type:complete len:495 (-) Transcript_7348:439-1923(-)
MYEQTGGLAVVGSPPEMPTRPPPREGVLSPSRRPLFGSPLTRRPSETPARQAPFIIGVAGGTASGKTTVCNQIMQNLHDQRVSLISMDSFYRGLTEEEKVNVQLQEYNFDHPNAFDAEEILFVLTELQKGGPVEIPVYCFVTHSRLKETRLVNPCDVVIIEGILLFQFAELLEKLNMKIFVDTDDDVRLARRIQRDIVERGRDVKGVIEQYTKFVKPMFDNFVLPSKKVADIIIPWARGDNLVAIDLIVQHILTKLGQTDLRRIFPNLDVLPGNYQTRGMHTIIRDRNTSKSDFVFYADRLIRLVVEHGLGQLPFTEKMVTTPVDGTYVGLSFTRGLCGVSVIRSGEAMENALRDCCKGIKIGKMLLDRPTKTLNRENSRSSLNEDNDGKVDKIRLIYEKLPGDIAQRHVLLLDPILATGNSANEAISVLLQRGVPEKCIVFCTLIAAPEGVTAVCSKHPEVRVITSEIDSGLDSDARVLPGIGEFADRYFGTD